MLRDSARELPGGRSETWCERLVNLEAEKITPCMMSHIYLFSMIQRLWLSHYLDKDDLTLLEYHIMIVCNLSPVISRDLAGQSRCRIRRHANVIVCSSAGGH